MELQALDTVVAGSWVEAGSRNLSSLWRLVIVNVSQARVELLSYAIQRTLKRLNFLQLEGSCIPSGLGLDLTGHQCLQ